MLIEIQNDLFILQTLNSISPLPDADMFKGAKNPENVNKNRYDNILPSKLQI